MKFYLTEQQDNCHLDNPYQVEDVVIGEFNDSLNDAISHFHIVPVAVKSQREYLVRLPSGTIGSLKSQDAFVFDPLCPNCRELETSFDNVINAYVCPRCI